jgi:hypothetical protein
VLVVGRDSTRSNRVEWLRESPECAIDPRRELNEWAEDYNPMRPLARNVEQKGRE